MNSVWIGIARFRPFNTWEIDLQGPRWKKTDYDGLKGFPKYVIDKSTGDRYYNQSFKNIRLKAAGAFLGMVQI